MNKADAVNAVASATGLTKKDAAAAIEALLDAITDSLKRGNSSTFTGFGTFSVAERKARTGRNPQTGAVIQIPAKTVAKFKPGKQLKDAVA
ncbi:HU family DNA-binding protein [Candidatus Dojkabacteria bacterium]|uniref:HU family DNA-binding protein n=1 Tax=Candidatus Dojkabacteria bacterium TaxID=2099670 RepID=A0A955L815_9BACT|nr:HU family DNA-binding protein [Candidatus Dojkabacteria bacterium]